MRTEYRATAEPDSPGAPPTGGSERVGGGDYDGGVLAHEHDAGIEGNRVADELTEGEDDGLPTFAGDVQDSGQP